MEFSIFEELMSPRMESWVTIPNELNEVSPNVWSFSSSHQIPDFEMSNSLLLDQFSHRYPFYEPQTLLDNFALPQVCSSYNYPNENSAPIQEDYSANLENEDFGLLDNAGLNGFEHETSRFKVETLEAPKNMDNSNVGFSTERKNKSKADGLPSKNLMAERRRRKRLNDRLSMLRSIVPKISKMDRTSILGDTIDYMKELLYKINKLREEEIDKNINQMNLTGNLKEIKPNDDQVLVRNPSKFHVERKDQDTRIEICCTEKSGLLLSTLTTLEALGLDIQQCVVSCFNEFSLQASCYEAVEHRLVMSCEDVKQALFRNVGYGGSDCTKYGY
ncbi:transcription factor bHLH93-like [Olea europaea subsp. europaea]|uniref:Transcription factor bHLH93-like n=1 Tax=Olea europaea subsp. europaea TaxID=158383 RepID=A0A8S0VPM9_OLEEU|nr:transcription factor bHLH93-like [Olea europaea subsp. europaea]